MEKNKKNILLVVLAIVVIAILAVIVISVINQNRELTEQDKIKIVKKVYSKRLTEVRDVNKTLLDHTIDSVRIEDVEKLRAEYPNDSTWEDDNIYAFVVYSVKPKDINELTWIAGNGEIKDGWVKNKSAMVVIDKKDNKYEVVSEGTAW